MADGGKEDWEGLKEEEGHIGREDLQKMIRFMETSGYRVLPPSSTPHRVASHSFSSSPSTHYVQPPRISTFSGSDAKGESSFESWVFEVKCLLRDRDYPTSILTQAVRKSLKGEAGKVVLLLGESASVEEILAKLDSIYGVVSSADTLLQDFFTDCQKDSESVATWACRLEDTLMKVKMKGDFINEGSGDCILKTKFWSGLKNDRLKDATRHKFDDCTDFDSLLRVVRETEQELTGSNRVKDSKQKKPQVHSQVVDADISQYLKDIIKRLENLEKNQISSNQHKSSKLEKDVGEIVTRLTKLESKVGQVTQSGSNSGNSSSRCSGQGRGRGMVSNRALNQS
ncbi:uncharacterized protein LOC124123221 [Haliotis rufescens]|uniref:uncharacterized protein LOC124123221 n=1 Tax=Haliotis rufescens TaxID=6454 RepID=UPI00201ECFA9|nr:uncharacterized protein LOC124123221 [Haliotis rufescens]